MLTFDSCIASLRVGRSLCHGVYLRISRQVGLFESAHCNDESIAMQVGFILSAFFLDFF